MQVPPKSWIPLEKDLVLLEWGSSSSLQLGPLKVGAPQVSVLVALKSLDLVLLQNPVWDAL